MVFHNVSKRSVKSLTALFGIAAGIALLAGCSKEETPAPPAGGTPTGAATNVKPASAKKKIVFVFKSGGGSYSEACKSGAEQANNDASLNVEVQYQASTEGTAEKQKDIIEQAIVGHADAIVVSPVDSKAIIPSLQKAKEKGVRVFTWDADAPDSAREFYFAAADDVQIGVDIGEALAKGIGGKGKVLLFSGQQTAENLNKHLDGIKQGLAKFPGIKVASPTYYNDDSDEKAKSMARDALQANPDAVGIACANSPSPTGAAEALRALKRVGKVKVWGLSLPTPNAPYLKEGSITGLFLWDPGKLTYVTAKMVKQILDGTAPKDGDTITEGKLKVSGATVTLPLRLEINKENVDSLKF